MTSNQIRNRRLELGLTLDELAFALDVDQTELLRIEAGESDTVRTRAFEEAFDLFEERVFGTFAGA